MKSGTNIQQSPELFDHYPDTVKQKLLALRQLIFDTFAELKDVGELEETLKWGQPSYLTKNPQAGSTIRIDTIKNNPEEYALYVHCQTNLIDNFRQMYANKLKFVGKRAIIFNVKNELPTKELSHCIALALTYHLNK